LKGDRNANRVLKELEPCLNKVRLNENVYYLNAEGRERVGATKVLKKTQQITHHLMRNSLFIAKGCPATWKNEVKFSVEKEVTVIADAAFIFNGAYNIIEIDNAQKMSANREKINKYKRLIELQAFEKPPKLTWVTTTEHRKKQLLALCEGLQVTVYLAKDFI
jgi:hypothetical protein